MCVNYAEVLNWHTHGDRRDDRVCGGRFSLYWDGSGWSIHHHMTCDKNREEKSDAVNDGKKKSSPEAS